MIVSIAVVAYNEEKTLPGLLTEIVAQDYPHDKLEILLIDSMSTDATRRVMEDFASSTEGFFGIRVFENLGKTLPYGCNVMLKEYKGDAIVRIDAHASVPKDFISKNVTVLQSGEMVSGGRRPNVILNPNAWKNTLLAAEQSMFGSGFASYRRSEEKNYVDSIFHGMYRREVYDTVGLYDERLARTEDNDMSYRIRKAGFKMCYDPNIISYQHTRSSLKLMLRQKYLNGYWIGKTMGIQPKCFSLFHFVPFAFVLGILLTTVLACVGFPWLGMLMWGLYGVLMVLFTIIEMIANGFSWPKLLLPFLFLLLHLSYGWGTLVGLIEMPFWVKKIKK